MKRAAHSFHPVSNSTHQGDRFIPNRSILDLEYSHYLLTCQENQKNIDTNEKYHNLLAEYLLQKGSAKKQSSQVLSFGTKHSNSTRPIDELFLNRSNRIRKTEETIKVPRRRISSEPSRILDAPDLIDDYYLNLISWSNSNILAVALGPTVYLWNAETGAIDELMTCCDPENYVTSVSWMEKNESENKLALGMNNHRTEIWDTFLKKNIRTLYGHSSRVGSLAWNENVLTTGSRDSKIINHDIRTRRTAVSTLLAHQQEVCGLRWSLDGKLLASGGNDNMLCIWDNQQTTLPRFSCRQHTAAVKAIAWCPWERNLLASGGGTSDRTIKFWNAANGTLLNSIDTGSQVCSLLWSRCDKEILSSHGYAKHEITLWRYPTMTKIKELTGHTARVLHMAPSPDGSSVVTAGADETLRFWKVFTPVKNHRVLNDRNHGCLNSVMGIR